MRTSKTHKPFYRLVTIQYPTDKDGTGWRYIYVHTKDLEKDHNKTLEELRKIGIE